MKSPRQAVPSHLLTTLLALTLLVPAIAWAGKKKDKSNPTTAAVTMPPGLQRAPYLQALAADSVLVVWDSPLDASPAVDFGPSKDYGQTVAATSDEKRRVARLLGLQPGTTYWYRVRAGSQVLAEGESCRFTTDAGPTDREFSFFVTGDVGDDNGDQATTAASILRATPRPEFGLITGDVVYSKGRSEDYDFNLMSRWKDMLCTVNVWPALGNHDWKSNPETNYRREWYLPNNEHWYSFDWGSAHCIALDTRDADIYDPAAQVAWLRQDLQAHRGAEWTFVYYHHPGITCTYKKNCEAVVRHLLPVFDEFGVDVVFNGHAHTYERLFPIRGGKPVDESQDPHYTDPEGTIYIVSGAGAKVKEGKRTTLCGPTAFFKDHTVLWTQVLVSGSTCTIRSRQSADDAPVDEITITKTRLTSNTPPAQGP